MKPILLIMFLILCVVYESNAQYINYSEEGKVEVLAEYCEIKLEYANEETDREASLLNKSFLSSSIISSFIPLLYNRIEKGIGNYQRKEVLKYNATYSGKTSGEGMYKDYSNAPNNIIINLPKIFITRYITTVDEEKILASKIVLKPDLSEDKKAYRYQLESYELIYSKSKIKNDFDYITSEITITFNPLYIKEGSYDNTLKSEAKLRTRPMQVGNTEKNYLKDSIFTNWIPLPPLSYKSDNKTLEYTSLFNLEVLVTEANDYKQKYVDKKEDYENYDESNKALIEKILEELLKKENNSN